MPDAARRHLESGAALEKIGLFKEAEDQYLSALTKSGSATSQITQALQRVREAQQRANSASGDQRSEKHFQLGVELLRKGQFDEALQAFQRAYDDAESPNARARAKAAVGDALKAKNSFWRKLAEDWAEPAARAFLMLVIIFLLYTIIGKVGRALVRFSSRIEVNNFEDTTDTGFGKGFPALLRNIYEDRNQLARESLALPGSGILTYRSPQTAQPVMGSPKYEAFSEIKLELVGVDVSEIFRKLKGLLLQPRYSVHGAIYSCGQEIRASATLAKYNGIVERWDFVLWNGQPQGPLPSDSAYQIIDAILRDWRKSNA